MPNCIIAGPPAPDENTSCDTGADIILYCNGDEIDRVHITFPECAGLIGYTALVMGLNESQGLSVLNAVPGYTYHWSLVGGGTLSETEGLGTTYTSPDNNEDCGYWPIITLSCSCGGTLDQINLTITSMAADPCQTAVIEFAYRDMTYNIHHPPDNDGMCCYLYYNCMGNKIEISPNCLNYGLGSSIYCTDDYPNIANRAFYPVNEGCGVEIWPPFQDVRTEEMKAAGCCPPQVM